MPVLRGELLWQPDAPLKKASRLQAFIDWLSARRGLAFKDYGTLWQWSVDDIDDF